LTLCRRVDDEALEQRDFHFKFLGHSQNLEKLQSRV
jgi:hypothetical protein